jgi:hypothetical protein
MFIGHYGVSLAAKRYNPTISLAVLFLAQSMLRRSSGASLPRTRSTEIDLRCRKDRR